MREFGARSGWIIQTASKACDRPFLFRGYGMRNENSALIIPQADNDKRHIYVS